MKEIIQTIRKETMIRSLCLIGFGLLALFIPRQLYKILVILIVGFLAVLGLFHLINSIQKKREGMPYVFSLIYSLILLVAALIIYLYNVQLASLSVVLLGILILLNGAGHIIRFTGGREYVNGPSTAIVVTGIIGIVAGVVVILNPFGTVLVLFRFIGAVLIFIGIADIYFWKKVAY